MPRSNRCSGSRRRPTAQQCPRAPRHAPRLMRRLQAGLTQAKLAERSGVPQPDIAAYESDPSRAGAPPHEQPGDLRLRRSPPGARPWRHRPARGC
ncbi:helix-turn-helix domain-containing protein [Brachybacterium muris]|uniref:helix-turn-helix domain-containing protein n=1 Tax=Brachybacterium muris TaxID=219301 RepID=UPI003B9693DC